jgi:uncharacterized protein
VASVTIRLDDDSRDQLEEIARTQGVTLSDLLRGQIDGLLGRDVPMHDAVPHALSCPQRHALAQQHEVLAVLQADEQESEHHRAMATVLREGYAGEYGEVFVDMRSEVARSECKLLWDILDMFRIIEVSIDRLPAVDRDALGVAVERQLRFGGFDRNDPRERRLLGYVHYLVGRGRWAELKPRLAEIGEDGNSRSRRLPSYERMLAAYTPIHEQNAKGTRGYNSAPGRLTLHELKRVADALATR